MITKFKNYNTLSSFFKTDDEILNIFTCYWHRGIIIDNFILFLRNDREFKIKL